MNLLTFVALAWLASNVLLFWWLFEGRYLLGDYLSHRSREARKLR